MQMRLASMMIAFGLVGCGTSATAQRTTTTATTMTAPAGPSAAAAGQLVTTLTSTPGPAGRVLRTRIEGHAVELAGLPLVLVRPLAMSGLADLDVDLTTPIVHGARDWAHASGHATLRCKDCRFGEDGAKLGGLAIDAVVIASLDATIELAAGVARLSQWRLTTADGALALELELALGANLDDSILAGCVSFGDHAGDMRIAGTLDEPRYFPQACDGSPAKEPPRPPTDTPAADVDDELVNAIETGIHRIDDVTYTVRRSLLEKLLANPMAFAKGARFVPATKDGKPSGFTLYAIRPGSVYARLGLLNGDTLTALDGESITDAERALAVYTQLRAKPAGSTLRIGITRRSTALTLTYRLD